MQSSQHIVWHVVSWVILAIMSFITVITMQLCNLPCQTMGNKNEHPSNFKELTVSLVFTDIETNNHVAIISI